ncbi:MAG: succinylglutamate desuccinylase/aspartoacylase family protein [Devosia sp.]
MTLSPVSLAISGDAPGSWTELTLFRFGPPDAQKKVYLQAGLHADEQPGMLILHHLLPMLAQAEAEGRLRARFSVVPMANPLGMAHVLHRTHMGRYDLTTGVNHNRRWPDLFALIGETVALLLGADPKANIAAIRRAIAAWLDTQSPASAGQEIRLALLREAHDADYVLDLHCDDEALPHIFTAPECAVQMHALAGWMGGAYTLTAADSGGFSFDEMLPQLFRRLAGAHPDKPIPVQPIAATLEYRGRADTFDALAQKDAEGLLGFFVGEGLIMGDPLSPPEPAPAPLPLDATEIVRVDAPGLVAYRVGLGDVVKKGDIIADLVALSGPEAFAARTPIRAGTDGVVISRLTQKYVRRGTGIAKIVGQIPLPGRIGGYLLED